MPTSAEFEAAARAFDVAADELLGVLAPVVPAVGPALHGGVLAIDVELTVEAAERVAVQLVRAARSAADRCRTAAALAATAPAATAPAAPAPAAAGTGASRASGRGVA